MKYTITIPQAAIVERGFDIDLACAAILDFVVHFYASGACIKKMVDGKEYFWISYELLTEQLPMLEIATRKGWWQKIKRLEAAGLLVICPENQREKRTFLGFGPRYEEYWTAQNPASKHASALPNGNEKEASALPNGNAQRYQMETLSVTKWKRYKYIKDKTKNEKREITSHPSDATGRPRPLERESEMKGGLYDSEANPSGETDLEVSPALVCTAPLEDKGASAQKRARRPAISLDEVRDILSPYGPDVIAFLDASKDIWADWLAYRSEIRKPYKNAHSFALLIRCAYRDAVGDVDAVRAAVERSRANGWQGLFIKPFKAKGAPAAAPHSLRAIPAGDPTPEALCDELRAFYQSSPQSFEALKAATPLAQMDYATLMREFCAYRVRAGRFDDTFAQHHAALELFARDCFAKGTHILKRISIARDIESEARAHLVKGRNPVPL